jgi:hypothetical protein
MHCGGRGKSTEEVCAECTANNSIRSTLRGKRFHHWLDNPLPHFSVSAAMRLPKSVGEPGSGVPPKSASRAFSLESARPALISLLSLSTISEGVFFGAPTPNQVLASKPGKKSPTVWMFGSTSKVRRGGVE